MEAVCVLRGAGDVSGTVNFEQAIDETATIKGSITGLTPGKHGFQVHALGDNTNGCISAGPHYDSFANNHGGPDDKERHVGDLGKNDSGVAMIEMKDKMISLSRETSIIGRTLVVHEKEGDLGKGGNPESTRTGNTGSRFACGEIGIAVE